MQPDTHTIISIEDTRNNTTYRQQYTEICTQAATATYSHSWNKPGVLRRRSQTCTSAHECDVVRPRYMYKMTMTQQKREPPPSLPPTPIEDQPWADPTKKVIESKFILQLKVLEAIRIILTPQGWKSRGGAQHPPGGTTPTPFRHQGKQKSHTGTDNRDTKTDTKQTKLKQTRWRHGHKQDENDRLNIS